LGAEGCANRRRKERDQRSSIECADVNTGSHINGSVNTHSHIEANIVRDKKSSFRRRYTNRFGLFFSETEIS